MAIGVSQFPILSFDQANPYLTGAQAGQQMVTQGLQQQDLQQKIQQALMANQLQRAVQPSQQALQIAQNNSGLQVLPSQTQADIATNQATAKYIMQQKQAQLDEMNARNIYSKALAQKDLWQVQHGEETILQTPNGFVKYNKKTGEITPLVDNNGRPVMPIKTQQVLAQDPNGNWVISSVGGEYASNTPAQPGQNLNNQNPQGNAPVNLGSPQSSGNMSISPQLQQSAQQPAGAVAQPGTSGNIVMTPFSGHSKYSNAGATVLDTKTGNAITVPTQQTVSRLQRGLTGEEILKPELETLFDSISPYVGYGQKIQRGLEYVKRPFNAEDPNFDKYTAALETSSPLIADSLLGAYQLNNTTQNRKAMQAAIDPRKSDNKASYARRIASALVSIGYREGKYQQWLRGGIGLNEKATEKQIIKEAQDNIYNALMNKQEITKTLNGVNYVKKSDKWYYK